MKKVGSENRLRGTSKETKTQRTSTGWEIRAKNTSARAKMSTVKHAPGNKPKFNTGLGRQMEALSEQNKTDS